MSPAQRFRTSDGRTLYCLPIEVFEGMEANLYLLVDSDQVVLVDCGTGLESARRDLLLRLDEIAEQFGQRLRLADVDVILVTHGHIDHFGGLPWLRQETGAEVGVHMLDQRVLSHYEERVVVASRQLEMFLSRAGLGPERRAQMIEMYKVAKGHYRSTPVDFLLVEGQPAPGGFEVIHVPGHCPGQVCLRLDDLLLTADQVLSHTTPHQAPESITPYTGLGHFLDSLDRLARLDGIRLALGGHEEPMPNLRGCIDRIHRMHQARLQRVLEICAEPRTVAEVSRELFGPRHSYHVLLALEEAGAHVEYLYQRGELCAANVAEIESAAEPVIRYRRCS